MIFDPIAAYSGIYPKCREYKFVGHGPLCIECYLEPTNHE